MTDRSIKYAFKNYHALISEVAEDSLAVAIYIAASAGTFDDDSLYIGKRFVSENLTKAKMMLAAIEESTNRLQEIQDSVVNFIEVVGHEKEPAED